MEMMGGLKILREVEIQTFPDESATLSVLELPQTIPFSVQRVYYISGANKNAVRGKHAHKDLSQVFLATSGSFSLCVHDGASIERVRVVNHGKGYLVPPGVWRILEDWSEDAVCLVLASHTYDESDYINDFNEFLVWKNGKEK